MRKGYTLAETLVVIGIITILVLFSVTNLVGRRNQSHLNSTAATMGGLLREAQSRSAAQASSTSWGVRFENSTTSPFFALFAGSYSSSSHAGYYPLPGWVGYVTSSIAQGSAAEVRFAQISGAATGSSSIAIYLLQSQPQASSTISISAAGAISY